MSEESDFCKRFTTLEGVGSIYGVERKPGESHEAFLGRILAASEATKLPLYLTLQIDDGKPPVSMRINEDGSIKILPKGEGHAD